MEDTPNFVMLITISLILIAVGMFVIIAFVTGVGIESSSSENFNVTDPSVDLTVTLKYEPSQTPVVYQFNSFEWVLVDSTYISYSGNQLTVAAGGMQG